MNNVESSVNVILPYWECKKRGWRAVLFHGWQGIPLRHLLSPSLPPRLAIRKCIIKWACQGKFDSDARTASDSRWHEVYAIVVFVATNGARSNLATWTRKFTFFVLHTLGQLSVFFKGTYSIYFDVLAPITICIRSEFTTTGPYAGLFGFQFYFGFYLNLNFVWVLNFIKILIHGLLKLLYKPVDGQFMSR